MEAKAKQIGVRALVRGNRRNYQKERQEGQLEGMTNSNLSVSLTVRILINCTHFLRAVRKLYQNRYLHTKKRLQTSATLARKTLVFSLSVSESLKSYLSLLKLLQFSRLYAIMYLPKTLPLRSMMRTYKYLELTIEYVFRANFNDSYYLETVYVELDDLIKNELV